MHSYHTDLDKPSKFSYPGSLRETSRQNKFIISTLSPVASKSMEEFVNYITSIQRIYVVILIICSIFG